ncbi:MAG TPA: M64 family metallopeptidase [Stackebrandtia sp.]|jgi:hypothetical protein|uniref:M64 family metallopeptidase n=1 Tax=Stackebrandtia sp. TaxID=2023065 RepID=UPI002D627657|nr:M64 family metallopeptidase [Stackebrandtia sp.]HZE41425.1 M64 family metallopeptidase [Stackebrandtia sp.]
MRFRARTAIGAALILAAASVTVYAVGSANADPTVKTQTANREVFSEDGSITRKDVTYQVHDNRAQASDVHASKVTPIMDNGPTKDKLDLVVVGDGYTKDQMDTYEQHVRSKVDELFAVEPYKSYKNQFNVWMVDVESNESGVDNDPKGTMRDTALDMYFYCGDIDRLLCVNETKANQYAAQAPDVDQVLALANTSTYGGAGGGAATAAGGNESAGQIVVHELGHSIGGLADEYDYGEGDNYTGDEVPEPDVSIKDRKTQENEKVKWAQWMGQDTPDGGKIDVYDGARYWKHGIYRPSENSIMRELGREFNLPSREAMVAAFHDKAAVATPTVSTKKAVATGKTLGVKIPKVQGGHSVVWKIDGKTVKAATGKSKLDTGALNLASGKHKISVTVIDTTKWVRDKKLRSKYLTDSYTWTVG